MARLHPGRAGPCLPGRTTKARADGKADGLRPGLQFHLLAGVAGALAGEDLAPDAVRAGALHLVTVGDHAELRLRGFVFVFHGPDDVLAIAAEFARVERLAGFTEVP